MNKEYFKGFSFGDWYGFCLGCILFCASVIGFIAMLYLIITSPQNLFIKSVGVIMILYLVYIMYFERLR